MTDHRRRAEELYEKTLTFGEGGHQSGYGGEECAAENEGDKCCIEKSREYLITDISRALKETEEETWARAVEVVERINDKKCPSSLCCSCAKNALREEAGKEGV